MKNNNPIKLASLALFAALNLANVSLVNAKSSTVSFNMQDEVAPSNYLNLTSMCSDNPAETRRWRVRNHTTSPISFTWDVYGTAQSGSGVAAPGDNFFETVTVPNSPNTTRIFWVVGSATYSKVKASGGAQCATPPVIIPCGTNLIVNGGFESGNTGFTSGYTFKVDLPAVNNEMIPENTYGVDDNINTYHPSMTGSGRSGNFLMVNGNTQSIKTVWSQSVNVMAGKEYQISAWVQNLFPASPAVLRFNVGGNLIGTFSATGVANWQEFTATFLATTNGPVDFAIINSNLTKQGNDFGIDDISFAEVCPLIPNTCYAEEVVDFNQKKQNDGSTISIGRSNPLKALGAPENNDSENFVSLGFGGDITLKFGSPVKNGEGADVRVIESTFGSMSGNCARYPETIRAFASQDGCNFVWIGDGCQDVDFDLGPLAWAQYIKLVDISDVGAPYQGTPIADAYDVDGIMCLNGYEENPVPAVITEGASSVVSYLPGTRKNGTPITASRTNPENALGLPQGTDVVNFVSLGFGGQLVLKFPYVIFDNPTENDLRVVETSFGNPSCASYPETAEIEGSLDGETWVNLGTICLDGEVDITSAGTIQYIRISDRSAASSFGGSADGYDVDGVVVINKDCGADVEARIADNVTVANEVTGVEVYPNPFNTVTNVIITTGDSDNNALITVSNYLGQTVSTERINVAASSVVTHAISLEGMKSGIYFIAVETNTGREVVKVVKH